MEDEYSEMIRKSESSWLLSVWIQPGAKHDAVAGLMDGCLKIRISAPAVDNKANQALIAFVAASLGLRRNQVEITSGQTGRRKTLRILSKVKPDWEQLFSTDSR